MLHRQKIRWSLFSHAGISVWKMLFHGTAASVLLCTEVALSEKLTQERSGTYFSLCSANLPLPSSDSIHFKKIEVGSFLIDYIYSASLKIKSIIVWLLHTSS